MASERAVIGLIAIGLGGCLVGPNPEFGAQLIAGSETGADATTGETDQGDVGESESDESGSDETGSDETDTETGSDETGDPVECPPGWLDCDDVPDCETDASDPATCGSCSKSCALGDEWLVCEAGICSGTIELGELPDVHVDSSTPGVNHEGETSLLVDGNPQLESYVAIPALSGLPPEAEAIHAELLLYCIETGNDVGIHRITTGWTSATVTWLTRPQTEPEPVIVFDPEPGVLIFDVTTVVAEWIAGAPNHGLALRPTGTDGSDYGASEGGMGPRVTVTLSW